MRPKLLALLAVPALALVGCSASEPAPAPAEKPSASASSTEQVAVSDVSDPTKHLAGSRPFSSDMGLTSAEYMFVAHFSSVTAGMDLETPTEAEVVEALHAYCESDVPFDFSDEQNLNADLAKMVGPSCSELDN